jgi:O-acetyl-ADP-ribose deacetylase (regulator of RNase III)
MVKIVTGNILESNAQALVNTVNLEGFMGKGIAYQFKQEYPENNAAYIEACNKKEIDIGKVFVFREKGKLIVNFPTKRAWREKSDYSFIEQGMKSLVQNIQSLDIQSIAIPPLGCGNGGLDWTKVKEIILRNLEAIPDSVEIAVYAPSKYYSSTSVNAPALSFSHLLLMVLKENLNKFNKLRLQKAAYFVNLFSRSNYFKFDEYKYGPYSHSIEILSRDIFEYQRHFRLTTDGAIRQAISSIISSSVMEKIDQFGEPVLSASILVNSIDGDKELEILSTLLWILQQQPGSDKDQILKSFHEWPKEKDFRFNDEEIACTIDKAEIRGLFEKSLLGYELNKSFF